MKKECERNCKNCIFLVEKSTGSQNPNTLSFKTRKNISIHKDKKYNPDFHDAGSSKHYSLYCFVDCGEFNNVPREQSKKVYNKVFDKINIERGESCFFYKYKKDLNLLKLESAKILERRQADRRENDKVLEQTEKALKETKRATKCFIGVSCIMILIGLLNVMPFFINRWWPTESTIQPGVHNSEVHNSLIIINEASTEALKPQNKEESGTPDTTE